MTERPPFDKVTHAAPVVTHVTPVVTHVTHVVTHVTPRPLCVMLSLSKHVVAFGTAPFDRLRVTVAFGVTAMATVLLLAACSSPRQNMPSPDVTHLEATANDALLTTAVKAKLITVDIDSTASLGVHVTNGAVTLTGAVRSAGARTKTVAAARSVNGVRSVRDELHIDPRVPSVRDRFGDAALAGRIAAAIFTQTGSTAVRVNVHEGVVTLHGAVTDPRLRDAAVQTARHTTGVRNVLDEMGV